MRVLTLGAGAIGGYFGGRLAESGADVTFLVREGRKRDLIAKGLRITSPFGDYSAQVAAITSGEIDRPADIILLTCKAYDLVPAIETIRAAVGPDTAILPLLNGIAQMETLNAAFGPHRVLGGLAKIAVTLTPEGVIKHLNDWRFIVFGEQDGVISDRLLALKKAFDRTSVVASLSPNVMHAMWEKLVHLSTVAGMTSLMRARVGEIARVEGGSDLMVRFFEVNAEIARSEGFALTEAFMAEYRTLFSDRSSTYTASMLRDIERGGPIEADHILGFMLRKVRAHGLDDTLHRIAFIHAKAYEERRASGRL